MLNYYLNWLIINISMIIHRKRFDWIFAADLTEYEVNKDIELKLGIYWT